MAASQTSPAGQPGVLEGGATDPEDEASALRRRVAELEQAAAAAAEREAVLRVAFEHATVGIAVGDAKGELLRANPRFCEIVGRGIDSLSSVHYGALTHPDDWARERPLLRKLLRGEIDDYRFDKRYVHRAGHVVWASIRVAATRRPDGSVEHFVLHVEDVSQWRDVQAALAESEERFRSAFDHASIGMVLGSPTGKFLRVNRAFLDIVGYAESELLGASFSQITHPDDVAHELAGQKRMLRGEVESYQAEKRFVHRDGRIIWADLSVSMVRAADGVPLYFVSLIQDIHERKRVEAALAEVLEIKEVALTQLDALFDSAPLGLAFIDPKLRVIQVNAILAAFIGQPPEDLAGRELGELLPEPLNLVQVRGAREVLATRRPVRDLELVVPQPEGPFAARHFMQTFYPVNTPAGRLQGVGIVVLEVTMARRAEEERRAMEAKILHAQKLESLGSLAGGVAHDFNNILTSIMGYAELSQRGLPESSPVRRYLDQVLSGAQRAAELTTQMLAYSGKGRFMVQQVDLTTLVRSMADLLRASVPKKCTLRLDLDDDLPRVEADTAQLKQALLNLVLNAAEAIGDAEGEIVVRASTVRTGPALAAEGEFVEAPPAPGSYACLEVRDTGCGMSDATRVRIFDPFFSTKFTGRGLGLAAVLGIVRGHRGALSVRSAPGRGAMFRMYLPAVEPSPEAAARTLAEAGDVLVVDDEPAIRELARAIVESMGLRVVTAADGAEAVALVAADPDRYGLLLIDLVMPRMDGHEALAEIRKIRPDLPALLSSGYSEQVLAERFSLTRAHGFVQKPYRWDQLKAAVRAALGEAV